MWPKKAFRSSKVGCLMRRREKGRVLQLLWTMLRGRPRANRCSFAMLRISWPLPKLRSLP